MNIEKFTSKFQFNEPGFIGGEEEIFLTKEGRLFPCFLTILKLAGREIGISNGNWQDENGIINNVGMASLKMIEKKIGIKPELPLSQAEIVTGKHTNSQSLIRVIAERREIIGRLVRSLGGQLCFDPAPNVNQGDFEVFPIERYVGIKRDFGVNALAGFISGFHIHYSFASKEDAICALNFLRTSILDELKPYYSERRIGQYRKLAGNSNFLPPAIQDWNHYFEVMRDLLPGNIALNDPTKCWWIIRIHPNGTLELRLFDLIEDLGKLKKGIDHFVSLVNKAL